MHEPWSHFFRDDKKFAENVMFVDVQSKENFVSVHLISQFFLVMSDDVFRGEIKDDNNDDDIILSILLFSFAQS